MDSEDEVHSNNFNGQNQLNIPLNMAPTLKLGYFDYSGRAELTRIIFAYGEIEFEDLRWTGEQFQDAKATLAGGQAPVLYVDDKMLGQSMAIARYAAALANLKPLMAFDAAKVDEISFAITGFWDACTLVYKMPKDDEDKIQIEILKIHQEILPKIFSTLEKYVQGDFFSGNTVPSLADFMLFDTYSNGHLKRFTPEGTWEAYPKLKNVIDNIMALKTLQPYLKAQEERAAAQAKAGQ